MSDNKKRYYRAPLFNPRSQRPFKVSRTKVELFVRCPRCFYLSQRLGIKAPDSPPFKLNIAIDNLLKKEAELLRRLQIEHPLAREINLRAIPLDDPRVNDWLDPFKGLEFLHIPTNLTIHGAPDDIWLIDETDRTELSIVDAKATHSNSKSIEDSYYWESYKRQVELNTWLLARQGLPFHVSDTSYFISINTDKKQREFNNRLEFESKVVPYVGNNTWVEPAIDALKECLMQETLPEPNKECGSCRYRAKARKVEKGE